MLGGCCHVMFVNGGSAGLKCHRNSSDWFGATQDKYTCKMTRSISPGTFRCFCARGWSGSKCHHDMNECESKPCMNGATCVDSNTNPELGVDTFKCLCLNGWSGASCLHDIDECASRPCKNGATCSDLLNGYSCNCSSTYKGMHCDVDNTCVSTQCKNGGKCLVHSTAHSRCKCAPGFGGIDCQNRGDSSPNSTYDGCQDNASTGFTDRAGKELSCTQLKSYCNNPSLALKVTSQCAKTCAYAVMDQPSCPRAVQIEANKDETHRAKICALPPYASTCKRTCGCMFDRKIEPLCPDLNMAGLPCKSLLAIGRKSAASVPNYCAPKGFDLHRMYASIPKGRYYIGLLCPTSCKVNTRDVCGVCSTKEKLADNSTCSHNAGVQAVAPSPSQN